MKLPEKTMQACAVRITGADTPGNRRELRMLEVRAPDPNRLRPGDVLVKLVGTGACATNREIFEAFYGHAPLPEQAFLNPRGQTLAEWLATGHEGLFGVVAVGSAVTEFAPGDLVVATVRPGCGECENCLAGHPNKCLIEVERLTEMGIHREQGTDAEFKVFDQSRLAKVPKQLGIVGLLAEPFSISAHAIRDALALWQLRNPGRGRTLPAQCLITGAGPIGISAALMCRLHGIQTIAVGRTPAPFLKSELIADLGALYVSTQDAGVRNSPLAIDQLGGWLKDQHSDWAPGKTGFDLIIEASGDVEAIHRSAHLLAHGGVLVLTSITGQDHDSTVRLARLNLDIVLGNKSLIGVVNAHREDFSAALDALVRSDGLCPGWSKRLLTHEFHGIDGCLEMVDLLMQRDPSVLKAYSIVAPEFLQP